ncbi:hypothetical protein [Paraburkholderia sp. GAS348]|uniref:hypothetical protein n=1 Tax=Paraburkholderia sp. GAS348 TaxID=3035132 RepID=UPI003D1AF587
MRLEAHKEGSVVVTARELIYQRSAITDRAEIDVGTLYIDALDEYRSDGDRADKAWGLTEAMAAVNASRWRLACRSEDWRSEADIKPFLRLTNGVRPLVVQLQALQDEEVLEILRHLGEKSPEHFVESAFGFGANGFLQSPLSVKLLHRAVNQNGNAWPNDRFALFDMATKALAAESNEDYEDRVGLSPRQKLELAGWACLIMLISGADHVWRSKTTKPYLRGNRAHFVDADDLGVDSEQLSSVLDSSLFKGEGKQFEPAHRTIAEFLSAKTLAQAITGDNHGAALPLSRAIALISGPDAAPPTELRGLYAWLAAHLSILEDVVGADRMIEADALSVLAYGDVSVFPIAAQRSVLLSLGKDDPYFRASDDWLNTDIVAFGSLANEELAEDFATILNGREDDGHLLVTVFEVLSSGRPVVSLRPLLRDLALNSARPEWQRIRAVKALLNGCDTSTGRLELIDALAPEASSLSKEKVRIELAVGLPPASLDAAVVKSILSSFEESPEDNTVGHLIGLRRRLESDPIWEFFDEPVSSWRSKSECRPRAGEVDEFLDQMLAAILKSSTCLGAEQIWGWLGNINESKWFVQKTDGRDALRTWLVADDGRHVELFKAILADDDPSEGPWVVGNLYRHLTGCPPAEPIVREVMSQAREAESEDVRHRLLSIVVEIARNGAATSDCYWAVFEDLLQIGTSANLLTRLTYDELNPDRALFFQSQSRSDEKDTQTAATNVEHLAPLLHEISTGSRPEVLHWAAELYFAPVSNGGLPHGTERIVYSSNASTAAAIIDGWRATVTGRLAGLSAREFGTAYAHNKPYFVEFAAIAGIDLMLASGEPIVLQNTVIEIAIAVLRLSHLVQAGNRRQRLEEWAFSRLSYSTEQGVRCLTEYWHAALDAGAKDVSLMSQLAPEAGAPVDVVGKALDVMLTERADMPMEALKQLLGLASKVLPCERIVAMAEAAVANQFMAAPSRAVWKYVAFYLDPRKYGEEFILEHEGDELVDLFDSYFGEGLARSLEPAGTTGRIVREELVVRMFGKLTPPGDDFGGTSVEARAGQVVRRALNWLPTTAQQDAWDALGRLLSDPALILWHPSIRHAIATLSRIRRDRAFRHPQPASVRAALAGGPPANGPDLMAVVVEELRRLVRELRTDDVTPWKRYWNVDERGKPTTPLVENECRDRLLERLRDRLKPYKIAPPMPEARRAAETRADIIALTAVGHTVPIEAKRNSHPDVWTAAATQLQGYANAAGADGHGIYLVFWFGNAPNKTPSRPDGSAGPMTAQEMEAMLKSDLFGAVSQRTEVVVFDVSNPEDGNAKPTRKRGASRTGLSKGR